MGRVARALLALLLAATLAAACTDSDDSGDVTTTEAQTVSRPLRTVGFDQERIRVAVVADATTADGRRLLDGVDAYWAAVAARGGVDGQYPVEVAVVDAAGDPESALEGTRDALGDVTLVALVDGPEHLEAIRPLLIDQGVVAIAAGPSSGAYADPLVLPVGVPIELLAGAAATFLDEGAPGGRWCPVSSGGPGAPAAAAAFTAVEPSAAVAPAVPITAETDLAPVVAGLQPCTVVWASGDQTERLVAALAAARYPGRVVVLADDPQLAPPVAGWAPGRLVVATAGPDWQRQEPAVGEMIAGIDEQSPDAPPSDGIALGWGSQQVVHQLLNDALAEVSLTREELATQAEALEPPDAVLPTWTTDDTGRHPAGTVTMWTPAADGATDPLGRQVLGVVDVGSLPAIEPPAE
jgi:hypothetical protein